MNVAYKKQTFIDRQTVLMADHLDHMEEGIAEAIANSEAAAESQIASKETLGGIKVGNNLIISEDGTLSVDTTSEMSADNTRPITSAGVAVQVGNIQALLETI